jgi:hypothetical protein
VSKELETVKKQLANAISDKEIAGTRAQQTQAQLQADLQKANEKVSYPASSCNEQLAAATSS